MHQEWRKSITTLAFMLGWAASGALWAQAPKTPLTLKPNAPERYTVVPGDTLWSIAGQRLPSWDRRAAVDRLHEAVGRVEGAYAAAVALGVLPRGLAVVGVVVGQQHHRDVARDGVDRVEVGGDRRTGVDDDRARRAGVAQHPRVGPVEGHHVGVGREHAGARLAERPAGPAAHRAAISSA